MYKGLYVDKPQSVVLKEDWEPELQANQVRIRSEFAAIKHGTIFHLFSGKAPHEDRRFDPELRLFVQQDHPEGFVHRFVGDMAVGIVTETGSTTTKVKTGDRVYCYGPVCEVLTKAESEVELLPPSLSELDAVCLDPSQFALAAVRDARVGVGDNVVVFGLGAIGLFVVQLLSLSGCLNIIAVDPIEKRRQLASKFGAGILLDPTQCDVAMEIRKQLGQGADIAIEASGHYKALAGAIRAVRNCARIVTLGFYKGKDTELELGAEWHHNRLELIGSMPVWGNPLRDYPGWDLQRLSRTLIALFSNKSLTSQGVVDPIVDFADSARAFLEIYENPVNAIKLGIRF